MTPHIIHSAGGVFLVGELYLVPPLPSLNLHRVELSIKYVWVVCPIEERLLFVAIFLHARWTAQCVEQNCLCDIPSWNKAESPIFGMGLLQDILVTMISCCVKKFGANLEPATILEISNVILVILTGMISLQLNACS